MLSAIIVLFPIIILSILLILFNFFRKKDQYIFWVILSILFCPIAFIVAYFLNNKKSEETKKKDMVKHIKIFMGIFVIIEVILVSIIILGITFDNNNDNGEDNDNGYKTECYTREDGKRCCISCKETSYGDIGCSRTCD